MILRGDIYTSEQCIQNGYMKVEGKTITAISSEPMSPKTNEPVLDYSGHMIVPGFINVHIHGGAGSDAMDATREAVEAIAADQVRQGVTTFLLTTLSADRVTLRQVLANFSAILSEPLQGAQIGGIHVEGPFISLEKKGAQSEEAIRDYDHVNTLDELKQFVEISGGTIRLITLAPERQDAEALVRFAAERNIVVSLGHSCASFEQARQAIEWGARHATHTFNGMPPIHHRQPGLLTAVMLDDRVYTEMIADGVHLNPAICQLLLRVKGEDKVILITDALRCAGMPDGDYVFSDQQVTKSGKYVYIRGKVGETLAGSILDMNRGVEILVKQAGYTRQQAIKAASANPARALGIDDTKGDLAPGKDADIVILNEGFDVQSVFIQGVEADRHGSP
ncbi:N-acetylglucosamine-6-phosphate deacetylase [candidate division KSB3 bacterium]|uniref:N-acetylglucosamine-6-phosphate deacetylase n=1 Tax=candidate division KSB3 bacterium TaxID=2044937 RepID=A0A2G6KH97_9BACT|nr:MAG: N-acetylglucosamine-6-phosphate deacetylase [candidate division KSB3 bacterium]